MPLLLKFINSKKYKIIGFDTNLKKIKKLKKNQSYISSIKNSEINILNNEDVIITSTFSNIKYCDVIIFALPTPLSNNKDPDMSYIKDAIDLSKNYLKKKSTYNFRKHSLPWSYRRIFFTNYY